MDEQVLKLLRKYIGDQCSPEELEQVRTMLHSNRYEEEWAAVLAEDAERIIKEDTSPAYDAYQADQLLDRIVESADIDGSKEVGQSAGRWWYAAAASVLLLITAGLTFLTISSVFETQSQTVTMAGEQTEVLLPDGTRVWLNDQSTLSYPEEFEGNTRNVQLEGRAFFDVASNPSHPFWVRAGELTVKVLGTSFDVSAYESDREMTVTVASGHVSVSGPIKVSGTEGNPAETPFVNMLKPGDQLTYDRQNRQYLRQTMALSDIRALREGRLVFQNRALIDIARTLERRYDITFQLEDESAKRQRLTFKPNSSDLDDILQVLSLVSGLEYERNGGEVIMSKK